MEILIILILIVILYMIYSYSNIEHMTNLSLAIDKSVDESLDNILHYDVCQIQQPQLGKNRPYVNWQKIHNYHNINY